MKLLWVLLKSRHARAAWRRFTALRRGIIVKHYIPEFDHNRLKEQV